MKSSCFENLTYNQIKTLIDVLKSVKGNDFEFIRKKYLESSNNFEGAIDFLKSLNSLCVNDNVINISNSLKSLLKNSILNNNIIKGYMICKDSDGIGQNGFVN